MRNQRGFSTIEIILTSFLILVSLMVFLSIFSSTSQQSVQSRNRTVAILLANTLMDEFEAHPYGAVEPPGWKADVDKPASVWIEGRQQNIEFHKKIEYLTGSFVGTKPGDSDDITLSISWKEGEGDPQVGSPRAGGTGFPATAKDDNKILVVHVPVWR